MFWNELKRKQGNEKIVLEKVKQKYFDDFALAKDLYLFLGTTFVNHVKKARNPFVIIGTFTPKNEIQTSLF